MNQVIRNVTVLNLWHLSERKGSRNQSEDNLTEVMRRIQ
jgi:hypothetical protein